MHCHILTHEDQGAMGTVLITSGCDGDYNDVGPEGSCHYVDTCNQFGTLDPTPAPILSPEPTPRPTTEEPTDSPTKTPTKQPTPSPITQETTMVLELTLRGRFGHFEEDAALYTDGNVIDLATHVIHFAHGPIDSHLVCSLHYIS